MATKEQGAKSKAAPNKEAMRKKAKLIMEKIQKEAGKPPPPKKPKRNRVASVDDYRYRVRVYTLLSEAEAKGLNALSNHNLDSLPNANGDQRGLFSEIELQQAFRQVGILKHFVDDKGHILQVERTK